MKVLIAEDDRVSRRLLETRLTNWGYDVVAADDGLEALRKLQSENAPKLVILDWMMPGMDGLQVCRELRKMTDEDYFYIILLTAKGQKENLVQGMEAGADDYIMKPFDAQELKVRLRAGRRMINLQEQLVASLEALRFQATHDPLTGAWNRGAILDILAREMVRTGRENGCLGVAMVDLDHFKLVNDTHGHLTGDTVLRETTRRMQSSLRPYDELGRYGGEEFLVVLPGCDVSNVTTIAERLCRRVSRHPIDVSEGIVPVTISVGVASTGEERTADVKALITAADSALYRAKENGRNRVECSRESDYALQPPKPTDSKPKIVENR